MSPLVLKPVPGTNVRLGWTQRSENAADLETRFSSYNTKVAGMTCDSVVDDRADMNTLVNVTMQPAGGQLDIVGVPRIASALTIPANIRLNFKAGAYLAPDVGITVTMLCHFDKSPEKKFGGGGLVTFGKGRVSRIKPEWWGAIGDADNANKVTNSTAIQKACDSAQAMGGNKVVFQAADYRTDAPVVVREGVSILGADRGVTIVRKMTATASTVTDNTSPVYIFPATVGFPVCVFHFVHTNGTTGWSYGSVKNIQARGDTDDPNTSVVDYGFFFRGISDGTIENNLAQFCKVGYFFGGQATIMSEICGNVSYRCHRGFYQHWMLGGAYHHNYSIHSRYIAHDVSFYYTEVFANGADSGGSALSGRTLQTEKYIAYKLYACIGGVFEANGGESSKGSCIWAFGCRSVAVRNNLFLSITSEYTGGDNIYALDLESNIDMTVEDNRFVWDAVKLSGGAVAGQHFNYRITGHTGYLIFDGRNRFIDTMTATVDVGWVNTSGSVTHSLGTFDKYMEKIAFVPGVTFSTPGDVAAVPGANNKGRYHVHAGRVFYEMDVDVPALTFTTAAGILKITGLPFAADAAIDIAGNFGNVSAAITYPAGKTWLSPVVAGGQSYLYISAHGSGVATATIAVGNLVSPAAIRLFISGSYPMA